MSDEVMTDLDRQIQEALAVDPSPDFQARVRIRLTEPLLRSPVRLGTGWLMSGVVAGLAAAVLAVYVSSRHDVAPGVPVPAAPAAPTAAVVASTPAPEIDAPAAGRLPVATHPDAAGVVFAPAAERAAFRRFLRTIAEKGLSYSIVADTSDDAPLSVPDLTIEPIVTAPIDASAE